MSTRSHAGGATLVPRAQVGRRRTVIDCGNAGRLTVREVATRAGINESTVFSRVAAGHSGDDLLLPSEEFRARHPRRETYRMRAPGCASPHVVAGGIAWGLRLGQAFPTRTPSVIELMEKFGVSRATAYRWRAAFIEARGAE